MPARGATSDIPRAAPLHQVVITRFNTRHAWMGLYAGGEADWLGRRFELFETLCYPSVAAQRAIFRWLVFFDAQTPDTARRRIESYRALPAFTPVFVEGELSDAAIAEHVGRSLPDEPCRLVTTRLDNDDAIADGTLKRLQKVATKVTSETFLNLPLGWQWRSGRFYLWVDRSNPFLSMVEDVHPGTPPITVYCGPHHELRRHRAVRQITSPPAWVQSIHNDNLSNSVRGLWLPRRGTPRGFTLGPSAEPSREGRWEPGSKLIRPGHRMGYAAGRHHPSGGSRYDSR